MMNILEYINELIDLGYNNEEAEYLADVMFNDERDAGDDEE